MPDEKRKAAKKNKKPDSAEDLVHHVTPHPVMFVDFNQYYVFYQHKDS